MMFYMAVCYEGNDASSTPDTSTSFVSDRAVLDIRNRDL